MHKKTDGISVRMTCSPFMSFFCLSHHGWSDWACMSETVRMYKRMSRAFAGLFSEGYTERYKANRKFCSQALRTHGFNKQHLDVILPDEWRQISAVLDTSTSEGIEHETAFRWAAANVIRGVLFDSRLPHGDAGWVRLSFYYWFWAVNHLCSCRIWGEDGSSFFGIFQNTRGYLHYACIDQCFTEKMCNFFKLAEFTWFSRAGWVHWCSLQLSDVGTGSRRRPVPSGIHCQIRQQRR